MLWCFIQFEECSLVCGRCIIIKSQNGSVVTDILLRYWPNDLVHTSCASSYKNRRGIIATDLGKCNLVNNPDGESTESDERRFIRRKVWQAKGYYLSVVPRRVHEPAPETLIL